MKITCQSCQAKYTIADDKVAGKVVKIRCKKCGATLVIHGTDPSAVTTEAAGAAPPPIVNRVAEGAASAEPWTVNVAEGDQQTMTEADAVAAFRSGKIDGDTYCWREGMGDWLPLREIPQLYAACVGGANPEAAPEPLTGSSFEHVSESSNGSSLRYGQASTARRTGGRAPSADLFGGVAKAGGEEEVLTSAPSKSPLPLEDNPKLIGARNETSVLFSLSAVQRKGTPEPPPPKASPNEASGLIDIRQLSAQLAVEEKKPNRVDDIMNLSGGNAFAPNLAAPALAAPAVDGFSGNAPSRIPIGRSRAVLVAIGAGALIVLGAIGVATMTMHGSEPATDESKGQPSATASGEVAGKGSASAAAPGTETSLSTIPAAPTVAARPAGLTAEPTGTASAHAEPSALAAQPASEATREAEKPKEKPASSPPVFHAAEPTIEVDQPFNMGEARARLAAAAAGASACKRPNGPTGTGKVIVLFSTNGVAQSATLTGDPFEDTPTGTCVTGKFKAVRVPPFSGSPFSVSKSFTIN